MGQYKRISRKKKRKDIAAEASEAARHWLHDNMEKVLALAGAAVLIAAVVYGVIYYRKASLSGFYTRLYEASSMAPAGAASNVDADGAIAALNEVVEKGGPDEGVTVARMELGRLYMSKRSYDTAAAEYGKAAASAKEGTILRELALAGQAEALSQGGRLSEAAAMLEALAESAKYYPRSAAMYNLAFAYAMAGEKEKSAAAAGKLESEFPSFRDSDYLDETLRRIQSGALAYKPAQKTNPSGDEQGVKTLGHSDIHSGG